MELKAYQQRVIDDLNSFLGYLEQGDSIRDSFRSYWDDRGATKMEGYKNCLLYTSPSPRDGLLSRMPSSA